MDFQTVDNAQLLAWHAEAQAAYQRVMAGGQITSASYSQGTGSRSVGFAAPSLDMLRQRIAELEAEMYRRGLLGNRPRRRRAIGIRY
jgi:hypothetical protein